MDLKKVKSKIPEYIFSTAQKLDENGYEAYLVGGGVRDIYMSREPKDYDIGTNAKPADIIRIFPRAITTGAKFGSIIVLVTDKKGEPHPVDVTTYRIEEEYISGRWPSKVKFTKSIEDDLSRRDFTWNAMAIDLVRLYKGKESKLFLDPFNGRDDLKVRIVKAVGDPYERLSEDALRVLRACRFASILEFEIDKNLLEAIPKVLTLIDNLSPERVREEFVNIIYDSPKPSHGLKLLKETGILKIWIPELLEGVGVDQPKYHVHDVFDHSIKTVDCAADSVKLAALFHDIAKPRTKNGSHFYRHDIVGAEMTKMIMKRLRFSNKEIEEVTSIVRWHMFYFPYDEDDFPGEKEVGRKREKISKWKDSAVRRFVRNVGGEDVVDKLIELRIADATANPKCDFDNRGIQALQKRIAEVKEKDMVLKVADLDINGNDLKELGIKQGPEMGEILNGVLEMVIDDPILNDKKRLLKIVGEKYLKGAK